MIIPAKWFNVPAAVRTYGGAGSFGPVLSDPVACLVHKDEQVVLVTNADGSQSVADMKLMVQPEYAALFTPESTVAVNGRTVQVLTSKPHDKYGVTVYQEVVCK